VKYFVRHAENSQQKTGYSAIAYIRTIKYISDNLDCVPSQAKDIPRTTEFNTIDDKMHNAVMRSRSREYHVQE
jgi:hypothetical protein